MRSRYRGTGRAKDPIFGVFAGVDTNVWNPVSGFGNLNALLQEAMYVPFAPAQAEIKHKLAL